MSTNLLLEIRKRRRRRMMKRKMVMKRSMAFFLPPVAIAVGRATISVKDHRPKEAAHGAAAAALLLTIRLSMSPTSQHSIGLKPTIK